MKDYKLLMFFLSLGIVANVVLFVLAILHGASINEILCSLLCAICIGITMFNCWYVRKNLNHLDAKYQKEQELNCIRYDFGNKYGIYYVSEHKDQFVIYKATSKKEKLFVVRTFNFDTEDKKSRNKAFLRAYSLLHHITDNGKLWKYNR